MIEINLLPGPKKKKRGGGAGITLPDFSQMLGGAKDPLLLGLVGAWILSLAVSGWVYFSITGQLNELGPEVTRLEREARNYDRLTARKRNAEELRDSLVAELTAIREIDSDRYVWPHVLDEVSKALPDYTWLVGLDNVEPGPQLDTLVQAPVRFTISGRTADIQAYTRFLRQLAASPWVGQVTAGGTQTVIEEDRPVYTFSVTVRFQRADSAFIQTRPLLRSVN